MIKYQLLNLDFNVKKKCVQSIQTLKQNGQFLICVFSGYWTKKLGGKTPANFSLMELFSSS